VQLSVKKGDEERGRESQERREAKEVLLRKSQGKLESGEGPGTVQISSGRDSELKNGRKRLPKEQVGRGAHQGRTPLS